ncbi:MAG: FtsQ-type POTRA domain-containing protein [Candidatus Staskawiczbacteria bacterium]|jgi:cell division septal protein FtsQ
MKRKESIVRKPIFWWCALILVLIGAGIYVFIFLKTFQVSSVSIVGNIKVQTRDIEALVSERTDRRFLFLASRSIFLVNSKGITAEILKQYPAIDSLKIQKKLPSSLIINILERKPLAVFCDSKEACFFIDDKGIAFEQVESTIGGFAIVRHNSGSSIALGGEAVKGDIARVISKIQQDLQGKFQINIDEANIVSNERLNVKTSEGWEVYFDLTADIDLPVEKMNLLLEKEIPQESRAELQYIDLRFKDRAYYK